MKELGTACVRELCNWKGLSVHVGRERELSRAFPQPYMYNYIHVSPRMRVTKYSLVENFVKFGTKLPFMKDARIVSALGSFRNKQSFELMLCVITSVVESL